MSEERINNTFDKVFKEESSIYDDFLTGRFWYARLFNRIFWHEKDMCGGRDIMFSMFPENVLGNMLDVPCGTGIFTKERYLSMKHVEIVCLDYSKQMIRRFKNALKGSEANHIIFKQGDVGNLPYDDESFDMVFSMNGYHCFPEKDKALQEIKRVLKKGGILIGNAYVKGQYFFTDLLVGIYDKKGIMMAPHETSNELKTHLESYFKIDKYEVHGAVSYFRCLKWDA